MVLRTGGRGWEPGRRRQGLGGRGGQGGAGQHWDGAGGADILIITTVIVTIAPGAVTIVINKTIAHIICTVIR